MMKRSQFVLGLLLVTGIAYPAWSQEPNKEKAAMTSGQDYTDSLVSVVLQGENVGSPRITVAPDGRLLVCALRLKPGPATLLLYASDDLGRSWDEIHDFGNHYYGPSFFSVGDTLYLFLRDSAPRKENLVLAVSADAGKTWRKSALLPPIQIAPEVRFTAGRTTGNTPVLVTDEYIIAAVSDWGGRGARFPQAGRIACGWCPVGSDPMEPGNWTWTDFLEMPDPSSAPEGKGGWLEPNPVIAPNGELKLLVRVDSADGELGAMVQVDMKARQLRFEDRFPAQPGQTGFCRMPGGGNGMFFVGYDEPSQRYLCVANPRTGGATELWSHTRIRNCLALFESYATQIGITLWIRADEVNGQIVDFPIDGIRNGLSIALRDGMLLVGGRSSSRDDWQRVSYPFPGAGAWQHVAVQMDYRLNRIEAWVNGKQAGEAAEVQFALDHYHRGIPSAFDVVGRNHNRQAPFVGRLDDLRFFRRSLTVAEIQGADE